MSEELQRRLEDVSGLIKIWNHFYQILMYVFESRDEIPAEKEREFQKIKTIVAEKHAFFMKVIERDFHIGQNILNLVKRVISLEEFRKLSRLEINKILLEWHEANILLYETLGSLEYRTSEMGKRTEKKEDRAAKPGIGSKIRGITDWPFFNMFKWLFIFGAVATVIYVFREPIGNSSFYQNYLSGIVNQFLRIFRSEE